MMGPGAALQLAAGAARTVSQGEQQGRTSWGTPAAKHLAAATSGSSARAGRGPVRTTRLSPRRTTAPCHQLVPRGHRPAARDQATCDKGAVPGSSICASSSWALQPTQPKASCRSTLELRPSRGRTPAARGRRPTARGLGGRADAAVPRRPARASRGPAGRSTKPLHLVSMSTAHFYQPLRAAFPPHRSPQGLPRSDEAARPAGSRCSSWAY